MSGPASSSFGYSGTPPVANQESEKPDEEGYRRNLSIGGAVLVAVGAKKILLPALVSSQPVLFAITASASAITGYRYIHKFWHAMTGDEELDVEVATGGTTIAMLLLGDGVTALTSVWLVNLSQYLKARTSRLTEQIISSEDEQIPQIPPKVANLPIGARLPKFLIFSSFALSGVAFVHNFWGVRQKILLLLAGSGQLVEFLRTSSLGVPLFTFVYTVAPLVLLPTTFLAITAGWLYGPVHGLIYSFVGGTTSGILAYLIGRRFGEKLFSKERSEGSLFSEGTVQRFSQKMVDHPFESVLMMELLYLPNDLVSYLAGFLQLDWKPFLLGNTLGNIPSTLSFVWFGASIVGNPLTGTPTLNLPTLAASGLIFVGSLTVSRYLSREDEEEIDEESDVPGGGQIDMTPLGAV